MGSEMCIRDSSDVFWGIAIAFLMAGALTHNWGLGWVLQRVEVRASKKSFSKEEKDLGVEINLVDDNFKSTPKAA